MISTGNPIQRWPKLAFWVENLPIFVDASLVAWHQEFSTKAIVRPLTARKLKDWQRVADGKSFFPPQGEKGGKSSYHVNDCQRSTCTWNNYFGWEKISDLLWQGWLKKYIDTVPFIYFPIVVCIRTSCSLFFGPEKIHGLVCQPQKNPRNSTTKTFALSHKKRYFERFVSTIDIASHCETPTMKYSVPRTKMVVSNFTQSPFQQFQQTTSLAIPRL